jgi:hypothetical protein
MRDYVKEMEEEGSSYINAPKRSVSTPVEDNQPTKKIRLDTIQSSPPEEMEIDTPRPMDSPSEKMEFDTPKLIDSPSKRIEFDIRPVRCLFSSTKQTFSPEHWPGGFFQFVKDMRGEGKTIEDKLEIWDGGYENWKVNKRL